MATDPARVIAAIKRNRLRNEVRKAMPPGMADWQNEMFGRSFGAALPRDPKQFLDGTFTPLTPIQPVAINVPEGEDGRPEPRVREMPPGWNMPVGVPGSEGFKLASFGTLKTYADIYSVARACVQVRKGEIRGMEWDIMPTPEAEKKMRGDAHAHRDFAERKKIVIAFFRKPDPDYLSFASYVDSVMEEMLVTDALSLYLHPTQKKGGYGPFGKDVAALEIISGSTIRPLVNNRGGRVRPPSPGYQQYLYGVPRVDLMEILAGQDEEEIKDLGKPAKQYRGDQLMYVPYTQRSWTPYGFPPLERTLIPTITGLRKQQYQLDYFDEGTIPGNYISPGEQLGWTPNQLQIWQDQNNALAGDPAWKHKSVALPPGSKVFPMRPVPLADQFDEIVMTQVCMGYDVMPMEMGISPKVSTTQSPGAANQMAKATEKTNERKSLKPTLSFLTDIFNLIIQVVWQQEDMRFMFEGLEEDEDESALVERLVSMLQYGLMSVDECRIALGKAPWGLPITTDPVYVNPTAGMVPLGSIDPLTGKPVMGAAPPAAIGAPPPPGAGGPPGVGGPPKPAAAIPGGAPAGPASAGKPTDGTAAGKPPAGAAPAAPGQPPAGGQDPRDSLHPDDKVGQARQDTAERHADLQDKLHQDFASGKPMEPPVRPPISDTTEDPDHPDHDANRGEKDKASSKRPSTKAMISELRALTRFLGKGRDPTTWDCRALPPAVLDYHLALLKHLSPTDAAAVTTDFIVLCFGPSTLVAGLEGIESGVKTFSTMAPMDSQDGKQGLAPLSMDGGSESVPHEHRPGCCSQPRSADIHLVPVYMKQGQFDNGATADLGFNGVSKAVVPAPKDPLPMSGRITRAWPGWRYDLELAAIYAEKLSEALGAALDPQGVAIAWLASQALPGAPRAEKGRMGPLAQIAWSWLESRGHAKPIRDAIQRILTSLWTEGFAVGKEAGKEMLDSAYESSFWSRWKPGDSEAARLTAGPGLQNLLQTYGIQTIRSVASTRLQQLANVLADGFTKGDSADQIAQDIEPVLKTPSRARMIAVTELARSTTQAAVAEYREAGFEGKSWSVTGIPPDNRVCPRCQKNGEQGAIPMSQPFDTGDEFTPAHPECRCAILPQEVPANTFTTPGVIKGLTPQMIEIIAEDLGKGLKIDEILKYAAPHLLIKSDEFIAGGLAVRARDTGRVLMIQRAHDEDDPAGGYWEFPGGRLDPGESVEGAARREWVEETGLPLPEGDIHGVWDAGNYRGHVLSVASEGACPILEREEGTNPDDPDNDSPEAIAWWDPRELKDNPAVRPELRDHPKRVRRALESTGDKVSKGVLADLAGSADAHYVNDHNELSDRVSSMLKLPTNKIVYEQLLRNYPPDSIAWVQRATWKGPYLVSWDLIDHDDMDSWAASREPEHVKRFERKIEAGDRVNPVVLVLDEGGKETDSDFIDVDGHHRALAYHNLGRPVLAWCGILGSPSDRQAMEQTHLDQVHEGASLLNKSAMPDLMKSWHDAWRHELRAPDGRWIRGGDHPGPTITFGPRTDAPKPKDPGGVTFRVRSTWRGEKHSVEFDNVESAKRHAEALKAGGYAGVKVGYAPGHDARHVSLLAKEVKAGIRSREDALRELGHSAALREKLNRHLDGKTGPKVEQQPPRSDAGNKARLTNFIEFYRDASDRDGYLRRRTKIDLITVREQIGKELDQGQAPGQESILLGLLTVINDELDRREPKKEPQRAPVSGREALDTLARNLHDPAYLKTYLRGSTDDELSDLMDETLIRARDLGAGHPWMASLRRVSGLVTSEVDRRRTQQRKKEARQQAKELAAQRKASSGQAWEGLHAEFGGRGQLEDDGTSTAADHLAQFDQHMPDAFKKRLAQFGTTLVATVKPVGGSEADLANVQPRGYAAGKTWNDSAGAYRPQLKRLIMGNTVGHGSTAVSLHEGSHALDHALGYPSSNDAGFASPYYYLPQDKMSPYYTKEGNPGGYLSETFAEISAAWLKNRSAPASQRRVRMANALGIYGLTGNTMTQITAIDRYFANLLKEVENGTR